MIRFGIAILLLIAPYFSFSQKIPLIYSGEVIKSAKVLYDSGKYDASIKEYLKIPEQDTNYVSMLSNLAWVYYANKEYDKTIEVCNSLLQKPTSYKANALRAKALAISKKGDIDQSIALHESAIKEFPSDMDLLYNMGITYYNSKQYEKAASIFFKILAINPYYSGCHLNLARISIGQGRKAHAMLAMGAYLAIDNMDNERLVILNNFLDNQLTDENTIEQFGTNASDKLDQIIRARLAMEKGFKSNVPINVAVVKQFELLFDQLDLIKPNGNNPWVDYYLPIYKEIKKGQSTEAFIYHILSSAKNETAAKWRSKNKKELQAFYAITNAELQKKRERILMPELGFTSPVKGWYKDNHKIEALGDKNGDIKIRHWVFFHDNNQKQSEGTYDEKGKREGNWVYYHDNGQIKSNENYATGEVTVYTTEGTKSEHFYLNDDDIHGNVETYYPCGSVMEKISYVKGQRHGLYEFFFPNGAIAQRYTYDSGKINGERLSYYDDGKLSYTANYKAGLADGPYTSYHSNGKVKERGVYVNDVAVGEWKHYYSNGRLSSIGKFSSTGLGLGEWLYYDERGTLTEKRNFDEEGRQTEENPFYSDGILYNLLTYKKGIIIKSISYNKNGKVIATSGNDEGTFKVRYYYSTGELLSEGGYIKGKMNGPWKFYSRFGKMLSEYSYQNGLLHGKAKEYYPSGELKAEKEYKDDQLDGYSVDYYKNSNVMQEGWFIAGVREQQWKTYYLNGVVELDCYYRNGEFDGQTIDYALDGKKTVVTNYNLGEISNSTRYAFNGKIRPNRKTNNQFVTEDLYANNQPKARYPLLCNKYHGEMLTWYPDGTLFTRLEFLNGKKQKHYEYREMYGVLTVTGDYVNDEPEGIWKYYHENGKLYNEGKYSAGQKDSVWNFYFDNGILSSTNTYKGGERDGLSRYYAPDGKAIIEELFESGDLISYRLFDATGKVGEWITFSGTGKIEARYPNGVLAWKEEFKDGLRHGLDQLFFPDGKLFSEYFYEGGDLTGNYTIYYANGNVKQKGTFKNDELDGKRESYYENGTPFLVENYKAGVREGKMTWYNNKGAMAKEFTFWNGSPEE